MCLPQDRFQFFLATTKTLDTKIPVVAPMNSPTASPIKNMICHLSHRCMKTAILCCRNRVNSLDGLAAGGRQ